MSLVATLYELINHCMNSQDRLQPYKLSSRQINQVFAWLDMRRRNYVDVSDFYQKFPDLNESELFYVFKYLDVSRKGAFTLEDLVTCLLMRTNDNFDSHQDPIRCFTNLVRVLKATFHLIQEQKRKLGLTTSSIEQIFTKATLKRKQKIDLTDLIILFRQNGLEVNEKILHHLKEKIFTKINLTMKQFVQIFSRFTLDSSSQNDNSNPRVKTTIQEQSSMYLNTKKLEKVKSTQKINSDIDKILQKYRNPNIEGISSILRKEQYQSAANDLNRFSYETRSKLTTKHEQSLYQLKLQQLEQRTHTKEFDPTYKKYSELDTNKIQQLLHGASCINQGQKQISLRRQQLRKGSIERQRIIDDVMNRKKHQLSFNKPGALYSHNLKIETKQEQVEPRYSTTNYQQYRPSTPNARALDQRQPQFQGTLIGKLYENPIQRQASLRPASAAKTANSFFDKSNYGKLISSQFSMTKPDLNQFYRKGCETPKNQGYEKENILRKAEQEATRKIQQIERRARLKVMEKRSVAGVYNKWLK